VGTIGLIAGIILVLILWGIVEHAAVEVDRSPERDARRPRYRSYWQFFALLVANGLTLAAYFLIGTTVTSATVLALFLGYFVFRHFLFRSPTMQARFLTSPLSSDAPTPKSRET
jgi:hypothetical protein